MKFSFRTLLFALLLALAPHAAAQARQAERKTEPARTAADEDFALERRAETEAKAVVSICLASGDVVVRGWDRSEVRARAKEAGTLRLLTPNVRPSPRVEVLVSEEKDDAPGAGRCGSDDRVELMVPRGATVEVESRGGDVEVTDVAAVRVKVLSGDVDVRRASQSVEVSCLNGDISVEDSSGPVRAVTVSGDVEARNLRRVTAGDSFEGKSTSGEVTIEGVSHGQVAGSTTSGSVIYTGPLARGGSYDFRTFSGDVTLELPADSSFSVHAKVVVSGEIDTDFPVRTVPGGGGARGGPAPPPTPTPNPAPRPGAPPRPGPTPRPAPAPPGTDPDDDPHPEVEPGEVVVVVPRVAVKPGKIKVKVPKEPITSRLDGTVGTGDAVVNLSSFSGSLRLRKM